MIDTDKYEGHLASGADERLPWCWSKWMLKNAETTEQYEATSELLHDAPLLLAEVKRLRKELKQTRESLWWCYDNYRFDSHTMVDTDWNFIGNLLGADMGSEEE